MKRLFALLLALALFLPSLAAGEKFSPDGIDDARARALETLGTCVCVSAGGSVIRWHGPIRIFVAGSPSRDDLKDLDSFVTELQMRVPGLPRVTRVSEEGEANLILCFAKAAGLAERFPDYDGRSDACFSVRYDGGRITGAEVGISTRKNYRTNRPHMLRESLVHVLGLTGVQRQYSDSILYRGKGDQSSKVRVLSDLDWLMLNLLYSPPVRPGDTWPAVRDAVAAHYGL
ncbi:MAG: DUF2927 domain-containing protein [Clostridia bacterium]|nr:DUF2927 domain-containing protein [Clostridia bacterium]